MTDPHRTDSTPSAKGVEGFWQRLRANWRHYRGRPREKVGFWMGVLLLFAPIFYFLLFMKPYSVTARVGWGLWLGLIVTVKLSGLAEPVIDVKLPDTADLEAPADPRGEEAPPPLATYLHKLEGGFLGVHVTGFDVDGSTITVRFRQADDYFDSERELGVAGVSSAFSLIYGRDFERVVLDFTYHGRPVHMDIGKRAFNRFFGMTADEMRAIAADRGKFDASPVKRITPEGEQAFFDQFATYR